MTQPRTVRNLIHSAHNNGPNPADPLDMPGACDLMAEVVIARPP